MNLEHHSPRQFELTVTDLKQWVYCPRIPYYHHVMPVEIARTYKMQRGRDVEAAVEAMEKRRGFRRYGLERGERRFGVWLHSAALELSGKLDLLIITEDACYPVDFKDTEGGVRYNHRIQLAAYSILVEENLARPVPIAFVYLVPSRQLVTVPVGAKERKEVTRAIARCAASSSRKTCRARRRSERDASRANSAITVRTFGDLRKRRPI